VTGRELRAGLALSAASLALALGAGEAALRLVGHRDVDGNFFVRTHMLRPYTPPIEHTRALVRDYEAHADGALVYDPELGWSVRPGSASADGLYRYDALGARTGTPPADRAAAPAPGTTRVALFGDSFTQGDDVPFADSWAHLLEEGLRAAGRPAEVVNLGLGGYGMDQALLRFRKSGAQLAAQVVVFGFQAENVGRNVNMLRPLLWFGSSLPFSKPRFVLEGGALRLLNSPALPPQAVPDVLASLAAWPLRGYESYYHPADYRRHWWSASKLASLAADVTLARLQRGETGSLFDVGGDSGRLALAIVDAFERDARASGAALVVVHLPKREDLERLAAGAPLEYQDLLAELARRHRVVDAAPLLLERARADSLGALFVSETNGHYSAQGNAVIADALVTDWRDGG
jgi:hypothetical protein